MAPLAAALRATGRVDPVVVATGQHTTMVTQALAAFDQRPDVTLELDRRTGEQVELVAELAPALDRILAADGSAGVVVQGDTTSALVGGLVAFWRRIPLVHLEAGLRSGDLTSPFPEEANRRLIGVVADLHLAPTQRAVDALLREHVDQRRVLLVGNTVVDAVLAAADASTRVHRPAAGPHRQPGRRRGSADAGDRAPPGVLGRRAGPGAGRGRADRRRAPRPAVRAARAREPGRARPGRPGAGHAPAGHGHRPAALRGRCAGCCPARRIVLSDSGGIQEEAPSFRVPVLVLRDVTERMEAVDGGWAQLVGTDTARIVAAAKGVLDGSCLLPLGQQPLRRRPGRPAQRRRDRVVAGPRASASRVRHSRLTHGHSATCPRLWGSITRLRALTCGFRRRTRTR